MYTVMIFMCTCVLNMKKDVPCCSAPCDDEAYVANTVVNVT